MARRLLETDPRALSRMWIAGRPIHERTVQATFYKAGIQVLQDGHLVFQSTRAGDGYVLDISRKLLVQDVRPEDTGNKSSDMRVMDLTFKKMLPSKL